MKFYRITVYLYLVFAVFFAYDAFVKYQEGGDYWIRVAFSAVALFMFFFRLRNIKNIDAHRKNQR